MVRGIKKESSEEPIMIKPMRLTRITVPIVSDSGLIMHRWSEKAKRMMLDKQMKKPSVKEAKDPHADYLESIYRFNDDSIGFPSGAFKAAIVGACRMFDGLPMTKAKIAIRVEGEPGKDGVPLTKIIGEHEMREDMVRLETQVADLRYRAWFPKWTANLEITFNEDIISKEQLLNLIDAAGYGGVGEWRPSAPKCASGSFGCFHVMRSGEGAKP